MDLVRDLLDKKVVDRNGREMGRVDRVVLGVADHGPPRVAAIEVGPSALGHRLHPSVGRLIEGLEHVFGLDVGRPVRIPYREIVDIADHVRVDRAVGETGAALVEQRLRRWVRRIPGIGGGSWK